MDENKKVKVNLRLIGDYMDDYELTVLQFCQRCQISPTTFRKIKNCENFNIYSMAKIAETMGVPLFQMFNE